MRGDKVNSQFMVSRVTGMAVGNDKSGRAKIYHAIATLPSVAALVDGTLAVDSHIAESTELALEERSERNLFSPAEEADRDRDEVAAAEADDRHTDESVESGRATKVQACEDELDGDVEEERVEGHLVAVGHPAEDLRERDTAVSCKCPDAPAGGLGAGQSAYEAVDHDWGEPEIAKEGTRRTDEEKAERGTPRAGGLEVHLRDGLASHAGKNRLEVSESEENREQEDQSECAAKGQHRATSEPRGSHLKMIPYTLIVSRVSQKTGGRNLHGTGNSHLRSLDLLSHRGEHPRRA